MLRLRSRVLHQIMGASQFLNTQPLPATALDSPSLAAALKKALDQIYTQSIALDGALVDYKALWTSRAYRDYQLLVAGLRTFDPSRLGDHNERLAFWINLYNALVIDAVLRFGVHGSIAPKGGLRALRFFYRAAYQVGGERLSCEDIEHGILRANRGNPSLPFGTGAHFAKEDPRLVWSMQSLDPRIHFVLNCGSISCPPIAVYTPENLDAQLERAARNYIRSEVYFEPQKQNPRGQPVKSALYLPRIFKWYQRDFGSEPGILDLVRKYAPSLGTFPPQMRIIYRPYDWQLNGNY